jgi:hypothetical protein
MGGTSKSKVAEHFQNDEHGTQWDNGEIICDE